MIPSQNAGEGFYTYERRVLLAVETELTRFATALSVEVSHQLSTPGRGRYYALRKSTGDKMGPKTKAQIRAKKFNAMLSSVVRHLNLDAPFDIVGKSQVKNIHRASAPGDPPAQETGALKNSVFVEIASRFKRVIGVAMQYGIDLELGTKHIAPRPFLRPAVEIMRNKFNLSDTISVSGLAVQRVSGGT